MHKNTSSSTSKLSKIECEPHEKKSQNRDCDEVTLVIHSVGQSSDGVVLVPVQLDGQDVSMELDTGASVSLIRHSLYSEKIAHVPLCLSSQALRTYGGERLKVRGEITEPVRRENTQMSVPLVIMNVKDSIPAVLGCNWLCKLQLNQPRPFLQRAEIYQLAAVSKTDFMRSKYLEVFESGLGTVKKVKATAHLKFLRPRPVYC